MRRRIKNTILIVLFIFAVVWILRKTGFLPPLKDIITPKPVVIDDTPILVREIKSIAELITVTAVDEVVVDSSIVTQSASVVNKINRVSLFPLLPVPEKRIVLIAKGKVLAGINLLNFKKNNVMLNKDTLYIQLPRASVLDIIMNPGDFDTFDEKGRWSNEEVVAVKLRARQKLIDRALRRNILQKAEVKAKAVLENFFGGAYKKVVVTFI